MSAGSFLIALVALSIGTYLMRFAGVKLGGAIATKGRRRQPVTSGSAGATSAGAGTVGTTSAGAGDAGITSAVATESGTSPAVATESSATSATDGSAGATSAGEGDSGASTERVTMWMDRATVVLIGAVFATTAIFDGQDLADPARLIGVGVGVLAAIVRVPMLLAVVIGMGVCALIRTTGIL